MLLWHEVGRRNEALVEQARRQESATEEAVGVFVRAIELAQWVANTASGEELLEAVASELMARNHLRPEAGKLLRRKLANGQCLIAIDALDEVPVGLREKLDGALRECAERHKEARLLLSSR